MGLPPVPLHLQHVSILGNHFVQYRIHEKSQEQP
jgi:hypothetical protein